MFADKSFNKCSALDLGCVLEDTEILGGDLTKEENGLGFVAQQDDDCSLECEQNKECQ